MRFKPTNCHLQISWLMCERIKERSRPKRLVKRADAPVLRPNILSFALIKQAMLNHTIDFCVTNNLDTNVFSCSLLLLLSASQSPCFLSFLPPFVVDGFDGLG